MLYIYIYTSHFKKKIYIYTCSKSYVRDVLMKGTTHMSLVASYVTMSTFKTAGVSHLPSNNNTHPLDIFKVICLLSTRINHHNKTENMFFICFQASIEQANPRSLNLWCTICCNLWSRFGKKWLIRSRGDELTFGDARTLFVHVCFVRCSTGSMFECWVVANQNVVYFCSWEIDYDELCMSNSAFCLHIGQKCMCHDKKACDRTILQYYNF